LVGYKNSICRDGRGVGATLSYFLSLLFNVSDFNMALFTRKYVHAKNHDMCGIGIYYRFDTIILEVRCEE
jgi:hypothetical protein